MVIFIIGPNWAFYVCFSFFISALYYFILIYFWNLVNFGPKMVGIVIYIIFYFSYTYTFLINPGYPKHDTNLKISKSQDSFAYCNLCKMWINKQKNTFHCTICDICIEEYDHHCIWTSKCIGGSNIHSFNIFVVFSCIVILYGMVIIFLAEFSYLYLEE